MRDVSHPEANLAKSATQDAAACYMNLVSTQSYDITADLHHKCCLSVPKRNWQINEKELYDLSFVSHRGVDQFAVECYAVCHIMGVHFRAGEWSKYPRCGSVVTCVLDGGSYYGRVTKFLKIRGDQCPGYASVEWFSKPTYPSGFPTSVQVCEDGTAVLSEYGSIIKITRIDPSRVMVEYDTVPNTYYVMRDSGYDSGVDIN